MTHEYVGGELELFATAFNWKSYLGRMLRPHIRGKVLDVGAGIGGNISHFHGASVTAWTSLEPDPRLAAQISTRIGRGALPANCRVVTGDLGTIEACSHYDTILYIDVLEHIADDAAEMAEAARRLLPGGRLVVLAPAHPFLFSPFDKAIGHHRRYSKRTLRKVGPNGCQLIQARMLDSIGFFASLGNRLILRSANPTPQQIMFWDKVLVPLSRIVDPCTGFLFGKSVLAVWQRSALSEPASSHRSDLHGAMP
jgi:SAM-dependent methyltransferase